MYYFLNFIWWSRCYHIFVCILYLLVDLIRIGGRWFSSHCWFLCLGRKGWMVILTFFFSLINALLSNLCPHTWWHNTQNCVIIMCHCGFYCTCPNTLYAFSSQYLLKNVVAQYIHTYAIQLSILVDDITKSFIFLK